MKLGVYGNHLKIDSEKIKEKTRTVSGEKNFMWTVKIFTSPPAKYLNLVYNSKN